MSSLFVECWNLFCFVTKKKHSWKRKNLNQTKSFILWLSFLSKRKFSSQIGFHTWHMSILLVSHQKKKQIPSSSVLNLDVAIILFTKTFFFFFCSFLEFYIKSTQTNTDMNSANSDTKNVYKVDEGIRKKNRLKANCLIWVSGQSKTLQRQLNL